MYFFIEKSEETTFKKMETQKIVNLLNSPGNEYSKIATKNGTLLKVNQMVLIQKIIQ